jgi:hypothetical protein
MKTGQCRIGSDKKRFTTLSGNLTRLAPFILALALLSSCSTPQPQSDISEATQLAISQIRVGMREAEAMWLMRAVSVDSGRVTYGGTGHCRLYFQCSRTQQIWVEASGGPDSAITQIGSPEPKKKWTRYAGDIIAVE